MEFIQNILNNNPWDWSIIIILIVMAIALGVKDGDKTAVPKEVTVNAIMVFTLILVIFNLPRIASFFMG